MSWLWETEHEILTKKIYNEVLKMSQAIDNLKAQVATIVTNVAAIKGVVESATAAFTALAEQQADLMQKLQEAIDANDPVAIQEATDNLAAQNTELVANIDKLAGAIPETPAE